MTDSLILADQYELIGWTDNPEYHVGMGWNLSAPVPDTTTVLRTFLDGDRVTGLRSGSRQPSLPITVIGHDRRDLGRKASRLLEAVDAQDGRSFPLQYTPDGGFPGILDCYRGSGVRDRVLLREAMFLTVVTLTFPSSPFFRSATTEEVATVAATTQVDSMNAAVTGGTLDTSVKIEGTGSNRVTLTLDAHRVRSGGGFVNRYYLAAPLHHTLTALDLSGQRSLSVRFRWPAPGDGALNYWPTTIPLTLSDGVNSATVDARYSARVLDGDWATIFWTLSDFTDDNPALNLTAVTSWSFSVSTSTVPQAGSGPASTSNAWFDDFRAWPSQSQAIATTEGSVVTLPAITGTARALLNLTVDRAGGAMSGLLVHKPPQSQPVDLPILAQLATHLPTLGQSATIAGRFHGTYTVVVLCAATPTAGGQMAVSFNQDSIASASVTLTLDTADITGPFIVVGDITLPLRDVPAEHPTPSYVVAATVTSGFTGAGGFIDVMLCDTDGNTVLLPDIGASPAFEAVYVDAPGPDTDIGSVFASATDRTAGLSVLDLATAADFLTVEPGPLNRLMLVAPEGPPEATGSYSPCWLDEADS